MFENPLKVFSKPRISVDFAPVDAAVTPAIEVIGDFVSGRVGQEVLSKKIGDLYRAQETASTSFLDQVASRNRIDRSVTDTCQIMADCQTALTGLITELGTGTITKEPVVSFINAAKRYRDHRGISG